MNVTATLTHLLRDEHPCWTICNLPQGRYNPLVKAGVLIWGGVLDEIDCDCPDCDCMPTPYIRDETAEIPQWAYTCEVSGEVVNVDLDRISYWEYDPDRFAEIVNERLECEGVRKIGDGKIWRLGHSSIAEAQGREIVVMTRFGEEDVEAVPKLMQNQNFLLLVGSLECEVPEDQFRRRIFTFDQLVRFADDGVVSFVLDEFTNRLAETVAPKKRGKREPTAVREKDIMRVLKDRFFEILRIPEWDDREKALRQTTVANVIAKPLGIPANTLTRYVKPKWKLGEPATVVQFWFNVVKNPTCFLVFAKIVEEQKFSSELYSAEELYDKLSQLYFAKMAQQINGK